MEKLLKALELVKQQEAMTLTNNCSLFGSIISLLEDGIQEVSMPTRLVLSETDRQHLKDKIDHKLSTGAYKDSIIISQNIQDILKATTNVIELKADKQYLFVFKGVSPQRVHELNEVLHVKGLKGITLGLYEGDTLEVIEMPQKEG